MNKKNENVIRIYYNAYHNVVIDRDERKLYQFFENRFAISLHRKIDKTFKKIKQQRHEFIENYYKQINIFFEHVENQNKFINQLKNDEMKFIYLNWKHNFCLLKSINWFVDNLKNVKLRQNMIDTIQNMSVENKNITNLESICIAIQLKHIMTKKMWRACIEFNIWQS